MDEKVKKTREPKKPKKEEEKESMLVAAAKAIGSAAGAVASSVGIHESPKAPAKPKRQKLAAKNKSRLPRRQKKSLKKAEAKGRGKG